MAKLPDLFVERLGQILTPTDCRQTVSTFAKTRQTTFRINILKYDLASCRKWLQQNRIKFQQPQPKLLPLAFVLPSTTSRAVTEWSIYKEGKIYLQNLSSMLPPIILDPQPGERILDLTAAPGSKTTQIAAMMERKGSLVANDKAFPRFKRLEANIQMQVGPDFVELHNKPGEVFGRMFPDTFDRVLIDAPCSSEGQFDLTQPKSLSYWSRHKIKDMRFKQNKLLFSAIKACKPGGVIVYSTCTFAPEENELVLDKLLRKFEGQLELMPTGLNLPNLRPGIGSWNDKELLPEIKLASRVLPTKDFEGFFVSKLKKIA